MDKPSTHTFYRIVQHEEPTEYDFWSLAKRGRKLLDPSSRDIWEGVSVFDRQREAREKAKTYPDIGQWLAELDLRKGPGIRMKRTGKSRDRHWTLWAEPAVLLRCVVAVEPVEEESKR